MKTYVIRVQRARGCTFYLSLKWLNATSVVCHQRDALHFKSRAFALAVLKLWRQDHPDYDSGLVRVVPRRPPC